MSRLTDKLFGTHSQREIKRIRGDVDRIESLRPAMQALTDEELRAKTGEFKAAKNALFEVPYEYKAISAEEVPEYVKSNAGAGVLEVLK